MQLIDRIAGLVRGTGQNRKGRGVASGRDDDPEAMRRALLTGGLVAAGAAVAAQKAQAAVAYVQLNTRSNATANTSILSSSVRGFVGISTAAAGVGVGGTAPGNNGIGVLGSVNNGTGAIGVKGTSTYGIGVFGQTPGAGTGVSGVAQGNGFGLKGSGGYTGCYSSGGAYGAIFYGNNSGAIGVYASGSTAVYASGNTYGVQGFGSTGVYGSGSTGVYGVGGPIGVRGYTGAGGDTAGVQGESPYRGVRGYGGNAGVYGNSGYVGFWGEGGAYGFYGLATGTSGQIYGVYASTNSAAGYAVWAAGNLHVTGTLSKAAGSFKIDHPLEPERKWLQHSFVESPDMMNVYNGNVTTDAAGLAIVDLPAYFGKLNKDFRYQLTVIGTIAQAIVDREIVKNQFRIRTSKGRVKVSWQVTGIRQDDYAKTHPIKVEVLKPKAEQGARAFLPPGVTGRLMNYAPAAR